MSPARTARPSRHEIQHVLSLNPGFILPSRCMLLETSTCKGDPAHVIRLPNSRQSPGERAAAMASCPCSAENPHTKVVRCETRSCNRMFPVLTSIRSPNCLQNGTKCNEPKGTEGKEAEVLDSRAGVRTQGQAWASSTLAESLPSVLAAPQRDFSEM